jgi:hypothetical protein
MAKFSSAQDAAIIKKMDEEHFRLYYTGRVWLVSNDALSRNIYSEPGNPIIGTDGATSVPANRIFTSATANFVTSKVIANSVLEIQDTDIEDNGRYLVISIIDLHNLVVDRNWPIGSSTGLSFKVLLMDEQYTRFSQLVPFHLKLDPSDYVLKKWGIEQKDKNIDAIFKMSILLCQDMGLTPKIGDRFNNVYGANTQQYEVMSIIERDQVADSGIPIHYMGTASRTREIYTAI